MARIRPRIIWNDPIEPDLDTDFNVTVHAALVMYSPNRSDSKAVNVAYNDGEVIIDFGDIETNSSTTYEIYADASGVTEERESGLRADVWAKQERTGPLTQSVPDPQIVLSTWWSSRRSD